VASFELTDGSLVGVAIAGKKLLLTGGQGQLFVLDTAVLDDAVEGSRASWMRAVNPASKP
jgi:hypothetical protein